MKIISLRKRIIINFVISFFVTGLCAAMIYFFINKNQENEEKVAKTKREINEIKSKTSELQNQTSAIEKYKVVWQNLDDKKKNVEGIKVEDFNKKLGEISKKFLIKTADVKLSVPAVLKQQTFKRDTIDILYATVSFNFNAINDIVAIAFVDEFIKSLQGYVIVASFEISKDDQYSKMDLSTLAFEKISELVNCRLEFSWYISKESIKSTF